MSEDRAPYESEWSAPAKRQVSRLGEKVATAAVEFLYGPLADQPRRVGRALRFELEGRHSARRGDHRIIYRIDDERRAIVVLAIEHRSDVYRPR